MELFPTNVNDWWGSTLHSNNDSSASDSSNSSPDESEPILLPHKSFGSKRVSTDNYTSTTPVINSTAKSKDLTEPDMVLTEFNQLTPEKLRTQGNIKGVVFDIDDTLSRYKPGNNRSIPPELKKQLKGLQDSGIQLGIISNNPSSKLVRKFQDELAKDGIYVAAISNGHKPDTKSLERMEKAMHLPASQMMMIGDNPDTDVKSGEKAGVKTAKVDWFHTSEVRKEVMEAGDKILNFGTHIKEKFSPKESNEPEFFPAPKHT
jgi:HAD superfamily phosphatase (TIGR01668 family)